MAAVSDVVRLAGVSTATASRVLNNHPSVRADACARVEAATATLNCRLTMAAQDAVLYLLAKGHRRIALINSDERYLYALQRRVGYRDALRSAGLKEQAEHIQIVGGIDPELGELVARRLLAVTDTLAVGAIKAALQAGLMPESITLPHTHVSRQSA